jgi:hypothetical protein
MYVKINKRQITKPQRSENMHMHTTRCLSCLGVWQ